MNCRRFRNDHAAFLDGLLEEQALVAMECHVVECDACARHDTAVRRSLLVMRNLPPIQPSADFSARLYARLGEARRSGSYVAAQRRQQARVPGFAVFAAVFAGVAAVGLFAFVEMDEGSEQQALTLAPVVATEPAPIPAPMTSPAIVASVSTGMPLWPAALMVQQVPMHLVNTQYQFQLTSYAR
ncbi:MAG TPA: hypothetical protein VKA84_22490 [Gemmatimonadaceae bacterium]|nr:hypothetical protein [Gemmatimonadaceae bacterium]